jgi:hypothetical protein
VNGDELIMSRRAREETPMSEEPLQRAEEAIDEARAAAAKARMPFDGGGEDDDSTPEDDNDDSSPEG